MNYTESKLIRRNSAKKLNEIFTSVKSAKLHCKATGYTATEFKNLAHLQEVYKNNSKARLYETGPGEYYLSVYSEEWYSFSTNEPPEPVSKPELVISSPPAVTIESLQAEIERLTKELAQATSQVPAGKAAIQSITLSRFEGRHCECVTVIATDWVQADKVLRDWAKTAPATEGTHKCDTLLSFTDGESFKMGLELQQSDAFNLRLADKVMNELSFRAGINPGSLTPKQYENWLNQPWAKPETYKQLLNQWHIPA